MLRLLLAVAGSSLGGGYSLTHASNTKIYPFGADDSEDVYR